MRNPTEMTSAFRERGLKVTPQRQLLFRLLHGNDSHPSADALYAVAHAQMPGISLRTVYQTLSDLAAMGELRSFCLGGATRFDPNTTDHHHALCTRCGALHDVYVDQLDHLDVHGLDGFTPTGATIVFSGLCAACTGTTGPSVAATAAKADGHAPDEPFSTPTPKEPSR